MYKNYFKRLFDIVSSGMALVVLLPVFVYLAYLVKTRLGSPVLFTQVRPGKDNKLFKMYKFRSMTNERDEDGNLLPDEQRHTKLGNILRKTSIDELPELVNILKGDMSLIGPRPLLKGELDEHNGNHEIYDYDYIKMLQSYNFGETVLNRILAAVGDDWLEERKNAVHYVSNWPYKSYGDALYPEHVLAYYHNDIDYVGAKVTLNGELVKFNDQYPIIDNGTTLVPIRAVSEMLNASVNWDGDNGIAYVQKGNKQIKLLTGTTLAYINDDEYELEVSAEVVNGRTLVPLRFVAEALDMNVIWHGETRMVELIDKGMIKAE